MRIHLTLDEATSNKLVDLAVQERRAFALQAEVLIMHALGTWTPDHITAGSHAKSKFPKQKNPGGTMKHE